MRTRTGAAVATLKLDEVALLAETARKSVLETSERADMIKEQPPRRWSIGLTGSKVVRWRWTCSLGESDNGNR